MGRGLWRSGASDELDCAGDDVDEKREDPD